MIRKTVLLAALFTLAASIGSAQWLTNGSNVYYNGGNVGIGTSTPASMLQVGIAGQYGATAGLLLAPYLTGTTFDRAMQLAPLQIAAPGVNTIVLYIVPTISQNVTVPTGYGLYIDNKQGTGTVTNYFPAVFMGGNVGIGTNSPQMTLDVSGTGRVSGDMTVGGNIAAKYQDVAEWVPSSEGNRMEAGTVVVLNPAHSNEVMPSRLPYDTAVAGVVTAQPGIILGEQSAGKAKIATTGRVKVHVDATQHAIRIGDLLVTSSECGAAMVSDPVEVAGIKMHRPGTIIGKALEPLSSGKGEILVLLSLQ